MTPRPSRARLHEILQLQGRLAEEALAALALQHQQAAQYGIDRGLGDAEAGAQFLAGDCPDIPGSCAGPCQIDQQHALVICKFKHKGDDTFLGFIEVQ